jgi:GxxExxY protein
MLLAYFLEAMKMDEELSGKVIGAAIEVHRHLGPGLLESIYELCLAKEFDIRGIPYEQQKGVDLTYKGLELHSGYRIDFLIADQMILELKSVEEFSPLYISQTLTYLRLFNLRVGLVINFNVSVLKNGIKRVINDSKTPQILVSTA